MKKSVFGSFFEIVEYDESYHSSDYNLIFKYKKHHDKKKVHTFTYAPVAIRVALSIAEYRNSHNRIATFVHVFP